MNYRNLLSVVAACLLVVCPGYGQTTVNVPLSQPNAPTRLVVDINNGPITVVGTQRQDVRIIYTSLKDGQARVEPVEGELRRVVGGTPEIDIEEQGNTVRIHSSDWKMGMRLEIEVPSSIDVDLSSYNNGDISLSSVSGKHNIETYNGQIMARDIAGSLSANTFNGRIDCRFVTVDPDAAMAFSNFTGGIDLRLPGSAALNIRLKTRRGEIFTDFDLDLGKIEIDESVSQEKGWNYAKHSWITGKINGGGPLLTVENHHGDIYIRK